MHRLKQFLTASAVSSIIACAPLASAVADEHGYGHFHSWGLGRGLVGAVVGLATLPIVLVSAAIEAAVPEAGWAPGYEGPRGYASAPGYYAPAKPYYSPPSAYYRAPGSYYAPGPYASHPYYAPRSYYAPRDYRDARAYAAPRPGYYAGADTHGYYPHR